MKQHQMIFVVVFNTNTSEIFKFICCHEVGTGNFLFTDGTDSCGCSSVRVAAVRLSSRLKKKSPPVTRVSVQCAAV